MKIFILFLLVLLASLIGGIYGSLYDQLTYTISPEFFTKLRFERFNISSDMNERTGAALVGFKNSWKTGMILGAVLAMAGLINSDHKKMFRSTMQAFFITIAITLVAGLIGWFVGAPDAQAAPAAELKIIDQAAFKTVENMNNFTYAGGVIGMFVGIFFQLYIHKKHKSKVEGI